MEKLPFTEERPWGWFREYIKNEAATVKILFVKRGEVFSLQRHEHRHELWRVVTGDPDIILDNKVIKAKAGDEFEIPAGASHRIQATTNDVEVLEISRGQFDENDILRIEDKYGRT